MPANHSKTIPASQESDGEDEDEEGDDEGDEDLIEDGYLAEVATYYLKRVKIV